MTPTSKNSWCATGAVRTRAQDYCGMLSEDGIRKNFVLVYELLDEIIDYGFPQSTSTDALKMFVLNEPSPATPSVRAAGCSGPHARGTAECVEPPLDPHPCIS